MTAKLTKRDKMLLYIMAIVLVIFGFIWLLIMPQMNRAAELDLRIAELETQKLPMETAVMGLPGMTAAVETAKENLAATLEDFYPYMENYQVDKTLTNLMISKYNLTVSSLSLSPTPVGEMVAVYGEGVIPDTEPEESEASESSDTESSEPEGTQEPGEETLTENIPLLTSKVTIAATGDRADLQRFVDDMFLNYPSIRVTDYAITSVQDGPLTLDVSLDFYMQRNT